MRPLQFLSRFPSLFDAMGFLAVAGVRHVQLQRYIRQRNRHEAENSYAFAPGDIARPLPRIVWTYWAQGLEGAPEIIAFCIESWRRQNPGWTIQVVDRESEHQFVDMADVSPDISLTKRANILRLRLLKEHGGVWADATVYCHRPLDDWLPYLMGAGFFMFSRPGPDRLISSWFIASESENTTISEWDNLLTAYWSRSKSDGFFFFAMHYLFNWMTIKSRRIHREVALLPRLPAVSALLVQQAQARPALRPFALEALVRGWPVSKLNRKRPFDRAALDTLFAEAATARVALATAPGGP